MKKTVVTLLVAFGLIAMVEKKLWAALEFFNPGEFNKLSPGSAGKMDPLLLVMLERAREIYGKPIIITSAYRTPAQNKKAGGVPNSAHIYGKAADVRPQIVTDQELKKLSRALVASGFRRIGISFKRKFIHIDTDFSKPYPAAWDYGENHNFNPLQFA